MAKIKEYFEGKKNLVILVATVLTIAILANAVNGFNAWRAERHVHNACNLLYPIGTLLKEDMSYGDGISYLNPAGKSVLEQASIEAEKAGIASHYFEAFRYQVISFEKNLKGEVSENTSSVYSPYNLYRYAILPTCNEGLNFMRFQ